MIGFDKVTFHPNDDMLRIIAALDRIVDENNTADRKRIVNFIKDNFSDVFDEDSIKIIFAIAEIESEDERYENIRKIFSSYVSKFIRDHRGELLDAVDIYYDETKYEEMEEWVNGAISESEPEVSVQFV